MGLFGMILLLTSMFLCIIGWVSRPKNFYLVGGGFLICIGLTFVYGSQYDTGSGYFLTIAGIGLSGYGLKLALSKGKKMKQDKLLSIGGTKLDQFFVECVLADCTDFSKEKNVARAKMFADKYKLSYPNGIEALYQSGLKAHEAVSGKQVSDSLDEQRKAEREAYNELNRYAHLVGKEKRKAMLTDRMKALRKAAKDLDEGADMLLRSVTQQEQNWGIWGGIADGLAGPVAGVSMAMDVQAQNAQIRAQNEANQRAAMPAVMHFSGSASKNRANADAIEKEIALLQEKLISQPARGEVLNMLNIIDPTVEVSETGAFRVTATVEVKKPLYLYDDVPALADGTIVAKVFEEGREIGVANMVLPVNGVTKKTGIIGMGLSGADPKKKHTVTFVERNLWLLEQ